MILAPKTEIVPLTTSVPLAQIEKELTLIKSEPLTRPISRPIESATLVDPLSNPSTPRYNPTSSTCTDCDSSAPCTDCKEVENQVSNELQKGMIENLNIQIPTGQNGAPVDTAQIEADKRKRLIYIGLGLLAVFIFLFLILRMTTKKTA